MTNINIRSLAHSVLMVHDFDNALKFYCDTLGFAEMMRINHVNGELMLVCLRVTDNQFIEIFPGGKQKRGPDCNDTAFNHICLSVENIEENATALRERGITITSGPKLGLDRNYQCWIEDPEDNRIEFMQLMPGCMQELGIKRLAEMRA